MRLAVLPFLILLLLGASGCKKKEPLYELKSEFGSDTTVHYDNFSNQPEYLRKTTPEMIRKYREEKKVMKKVERGYMPKQSRWDP